MTARVVAVNYRFYRAGTLRGGNRSVDETGVAANEHADTDRHRRRLLEMTVGAGRDFPPSPSPSLPALFPPCLPSPSRSAYHSPVTPSSPLPLMSLSFFPVCIPIPLESS